jgi:hypothetical protein
VRGTVRAAHCEGIKKREGSAPRLAYDQGALITHLLLQQQLLLKVVLE